MRIRQATEADLPAIFAIYDTPIGVMRRVGEKFGRVLDVRLLERQLDPA